jgi:hypothetical protein
MIIIMDETGSAVQRSPAGKIHESVRSVNWTLGGGRAADRWSTFGVRGRSRRRRFGSVWLAVRGRAASALAASDGQEPAHAVDRQAGVGQRAGLVGDRWLLSC